MMLLAVLVGIAALLASGFHRDALPGSLTASISALVSPPVVHRCSRKGRKGCKSTRKGVKCRWHPEGLGECREA